MLRMNQIDQIKELQRQGLGPQEISERLNLDRKTVAKYMCIDDFNSVDWIKKNTVSKLDPWKLKIDEWLEEDRRMRFKQRHTAQRVHHRLLSEYPGEYDCSYPLVQRYIKQRKRERREGGFLELIWPPGDGQGDFGEADIDYRGRLRTIKYLCLSFPNSNAGFIQGFWGETAECLCQGLQDIFHHIGGVPQRIVFDNGSGIGRRIREKVSLVDLFLRFKCHYGFSVSFCNPDSGHEKGHIENKIGYVRRNFFVPIPVLDDLEQWNRELFCRGEKDFDRFHYKKGLRIAELWEEDRQHLSPLPDKPFLVERLERVRTNGYGKFCLDGRHWYSSAPEYAEQKVTVGIRAHTVVVYREDGSVLSVHPRSFGDKRTDTSDYKTSLQALLRRPRSWANSPFRAGLTDSIRDNLDALSKLERSRVLSVFSESTSAFGFDVAMESLEEAVRRGAVDAFSLQAISARIAYDGLLCAPDQGPDLETYDRAFLDRKVSS
ncbi:MAG: IS21 family transposase [Candidatus Aminicenantes bacterium]|nr:IS21 family transposase [Candidatus Aminicenantes bacterium]